MRVINDRPPCLETPWPYFQHDLTPNEAFYVRWHLQAFPMAVDLRTWRLRVDGAVDRPLELSMDDLRRLGEDEVVAVNQCSGNSRGLFEPRVPGAQWRHGAMGNARWAGVGLARAAADGGGPAGRRGGDLRRPGRGPARLGPRFRQVARHRPRPPAGSRGGVLDERRAAAGAQRLPGPAGGARLVCHLLGQVPAPGSPSCPTASTATGWPRPTSIPATPNGVRGPAAKLEPSRPSRSAG